MQHAAQSSSSSDQINQRRGGAPESKRTVIGRSLTSVPWSPAIAFVASSVEEHVTMPNPRLWLLRPGLISALAIEKPANTVASSSDVVEKGKFPQKRLAEGAAEVAAVSR